MLAGLSNEHKSKLDLKDASHYKYLVGGGSVVCEGRDDAAEFADIRSAMKVRKNSISNVLYRVIQTDIMSHHCTGSGEKFPLCSVRKVPFGLMGCALAA